VFSNKGQVIRATFSLNLSRNIVALQVEKRCCPLMKEKKKEKRELMAWIEVYDGQRSLAFELTIASFRAIHVSVTLKFSRKRLDFVVVFSP